MKFVINSEQLLKQLQSLSGVLSQNTSTSSVIDCFKFETQSSEPTSGNVDKSKENPLDYEMPPIAPYDGPIPTRLVGFNEARSEKEHYGTVHFYIADSHFNCTWNHPEKHIPLFRQYDSVIGPDFSQYVDMTYDERYHNAWRSRTLTARWQSHGINVIPNVTWSLPDSYEYSFSGIPQHSIIAVNCTAIKGKCISRYLWLKGYNEMLRRLEPRLIIRYGDKMAGEDESISIYFPNERLQRLRQRPRKRHVQISALLSNQLTLF